MSCTKGLGLRAVALAVSMWLGTGIAQAWSTGITTDHFNDPQAGCNNCHRGGDTPLVSLGRADSTSSTATAGQVVPLEVTVTPQGGNCFAGFNVSTPSSGLQLRAAESGTTHHGDVGINEVTHTTPRSAPDYSGEQGDNTCSEPIVFSLDAIMPDAAGTVTLSAWGNNVNRDFSTSGDRADRASLTLTVEGLAGYGEACNSGDECTGGYCVDGVCCQVASCPSGDGQCLGPARCQAGSGTCSEQEPLPEGTACNDQNPDTSQDQCDATGQCVGSERDGTVWTWGDNARGQLGGAGGTTSSTPAIIDGPRQLTKVDAGEYHNVALSADGRVWTWGYNGRGQLGDPNLDASHRDQPARVTGVSVSIIDVAAGGHHSLALSLDGRVWAWGDNRSGQLGDPNFTAGSSDAPRIVPGLRDVIAIAAGGSHSMAITADGLVWAWGNNGDGQIGDDTRTTRRAPTRPRLGRRIKKIAAGHASSYALGSNGVLYVWGSNWQEALGLGLVGSSGVARQLTPRSNNVVGARDIVAGSSHALAIMSNGTVRGWGFNRDGELGLGHQNSPVAYPTTIPDVDGVIDAAAGSAHSALLRDDGTVWVTGSNYAEQLGGAGASELSVPTRVPNLSGIESIDSGAAHVVAVEPLGVVASWGNDNNAQLGLGPDGTGSPTASIQYVRDPGGVLDAQGRKQTIKDVAAGCFHGLALAANGTVFAWGNNAVGQAGQGETGEPLGEPVRVPGLEGVIDVDAGCYHSAALRSDGTVWTWGYGNFGSLGTGDRNNRLSPVQVPLRPITQISTSFFHVLAATDRGRVRGWGYNAEHQVDGSEGDVLSPAAINLEVSGMRPRQVEAGVSASYVLLDDGQVLSWGGNTWGELGNGSTGSGRSTPRRISGLANITKLSAGANFALAMNGNGGLWAWGHNGYGNYAFGAEDHYPSPALLAGTWVTDIDAGYWNSAVELVQDMWLVSGYGPHGLRGNDEYGTGGWLIIEPLSSAVQVDMGGFHAYAITP